MSGLAAARLLYPSGGTHSDFKLRNNLSIGELSQQFPRQSHSAYFGDATEHVGSADWHTGCLDLNGTSGLQGSHVTQARFVARR